MENRSEVNKQVVLRYIDAFSRGDFETIRSLFAEHAVVQGVMGSGTIDKALAIWTMLHESLRIHLTVEDLVRPRSRMEWRNHLPEWVNRQAKGWRAIQALRAAEQNGL